jgi:hypothetical protein
MQNEVVPYYRDPFNPEAVHFPAHLHVAVAHAVVVLALLTTVALIVIYGDGTREMGELAAVAACLAVLALHYPKRITTDEAGLRVAGWFAFRRRLIRWNDIKSVQECPLVRGIPPFHAGFVANWVIEIRSASGERPVRFTCRHSGRGAFLRELKRWGAPEPALLRPANGGDD